MEVSFLYFNDLVVAIACGSYIPEDTYSAVKFGWFEAF